MSSLRADHVGSLLRPASLLQARIDFSAGRLDRVGLRAIEDHAILDVLRRQRDCGLDVCTDGELRRASFLTGFVEAVRGCVHADVPALTGEAPALAGPVVAGTLHRRSRIADVEADFLREHASGSFKVTLPSPLTLALSAYLPGVSDQVYPAREDVVADASRILAQEARQLADEGVPYVQVDAPGYSRWMDPDLLAASRAAGIDMDALLDAAIAGDNRVVDAARAGGALTAVHICRESRMGRWLAEGGSEPIVERLFTGLRSHRLLLEFDSPMAGGFAPLRFVPSAMVVVLGLITTRSGELESGDELLRRIDAASRIVPLEQLALSPQCGFAPSQAGGPVTQAEQWRKLELVATVAREVWP